jgi:hypothetical protein
MRKTRGVHYARNARSPSNDRRGHGEHLCTICRQSTDRQRMSRELPPRILSPARADLFRRPLAEQSARVTFGDGGDLSLTVMIDDHPPAHARRFSFRAARDTNNDVRLQPSHDPERQRAVLVTDQRPDSGTVLDHADAHNSAPFLAGAIAQARPSPVLHNPPYREVAGAYRRSDRLGVADSRPGFRSDQKI